MTRVGKNIRPKNWIKWNFVLTVFELTVSDLYIEKFENKRFINNQSRFYSEPRRRSTVQTVTDTTHCSPTSWTATRCVRSSRCCCTRPGSVRAPSPPWRGPTMWGTCGPSPSPSTCGRTSGWPAPGRGAREEPPGRRAWTPGRMRRMSRSLSTSGLVFFLAGSLEAPYWLLWGGLNIFGIFGIFMLMRTKWHCYLSVTSRDSMWTMFMTSFVFNFWRTHVLF